MRVLLDCRYIRVDHPDGIGRYTTGLAHALDRHVALELLVSDPRQRDGLPARPWHLVGAPTSPAEPFVARRINRLGVDAVASPMQTIGTWGRRFPLVVTVHDLIYYHHRTPPPWLPAPVRVLWRLHHLSWWPQRVLLDRADAVAVVSEATAGLVRRHRLTRRRVEVVPDATDFHLPVQAPPRRRPSGPARLVYVGSFMPYKNVETLARAMAALPDHELHLVSATPPGTAQRLRALAGAARVVVHDGLDDAAYRALLDEVVALLSASRDEGFGLPVLEAMARGVPVVVSDIPAFRELTGPGPHLVDPEDPSAFAAAVHALRDPDAWARRSAAVCERAAGRTWDRSAQCLVALLQVAVRADAVSDHRVRRSAPG